MQPSAIQTVAIVGGGPAGLMAAEALCDKGIAVDIYDAMPSLGRKFLMAGKSGLNLTHAEPFGAFMTRFADAEAPMTPILEALSPDSIQAWAHGLGIETFVGSSGRVFPLKFKAAPLLRACGYMCATSGPAGTRTARLPFKHRRATCRCRQTRRSWRWAVRVGRSWDPTGVGLRRCKPKVSPSPDCSRPTAALMCRGARTCATSTRASR